jgi:hypothetical protein
MDTEEIQQRGESGDDAIIRVTAFRPNSHHQSRGMLVYGYAMMDFNFSDFARHFPTVIKASTTTNPSTTAPAVPVSPLGTVSKVPAELVIAILLELDISSLLRFRHVNRPAREFVSTLLEYLAVVEVAAPLLLSTVRSGISDYLTIASLYRALRSTRCYVCGEVGHLIYLLTAERCCWHCIQNKRAIFRTVTLASFCRTTKRSKKKIQQAVPLLRSLKPEYHQAVALINFDAATRALGTDPNVDLGRGFQHFNEGTLGTVLATTHLPFYDPATRQAYKALRCKGCAVKYETKRSVPKDDEFWYWHKMAHRDYFRSEFLAHFRQCPKAEELWDASKGGTVSIASIDTPFVRSGGLDDTWY